MIEEVLNKLVNSEECSNSDILEAFDEIFSGLANMSQATSLIALLSQDIFKENLLKNSIISARSAMNKINLQKRPEDLFESIIFSKDNYFDFSLSNDIICSANGLSCVKYFNYKPFSKNFNSLEILSNLDIVFSKNLENGLDFFERNNFGYFILNDENKYFKYVSEISGNIEFNNILKIINKMLNPYNIKNQFIGFNDFSHVEDMAKLCLELGNVNTIVVSSKNNVPFVSLCGETLVCEAWKNKIFKYNLSSQLLELNEVDTKDLIVENASHNAKILFDIFKYKLHDGLFDVICANAGLALYISKKADSLFDGIKLAKQTIDNSLAFEKLIELKNNVF